MKLRIKKEIPLAKVGDVIDVDLDYKIFKFTHYILTVKDLINLGFLEIV